MKIHDISPDMHMMYNFAFQINLTQIILDRDISLITERFSILISLS